MLQVNGCRCKWRRDCTYLGVLAEVLRSRCVVLFTGVSCVSDWHGHVRGWEGSMARRSSGLGGSLGLCSIVQYTHTTHYGNPLTHSSLL